MDNRTDLQSSGFGGTGFGGIGGGGIGGFGLVGLIGLLGRNGLGGGEGGDHNCQRDLLLMNKLGTIEGSIPTAALQTQNALLEQTIGFNGQIGAVKDTIQNSVLVLSTQSSNNAQQVLGAICALGSKIDQNLISQLQTELAESRGHGRARETEVNVSQVVNQAQSQAQQQQQFQSHFDGISRKFDFLAAQLNKTQNDVINFGTMAASGNQSTQATNIK